MRFETGRLAGIGLSSRNIEPGEFTVTHLGMQGLIDDGVLKRHLVGAHRLAAGAGGIAQADGAVGIHMHIAEVDVVGIGHSHRVGERLLHVGDAIAVIVGDGEVAGVVDFKRGRILAFAALFFRLQRVELPVGNIASA